MRIARSLVTCPVSRILSSLFFASFLGAVPGVQASEAPIRVAIVGLEHGHVDGFLHSLPSHDNVQLVGSPMPTRRCLPNTATSMD